MKCGGALAPAAWSLTTALGRPGGLAQRCSKAVCGHQMQKPFVAGAKSPVQAMQLFLLPHSDKVVGALLGAVLGEAVGDTV